MDRENNKSVDWVIRRGACHKDTILHVLYEQVNHDVDEMKKLELRKGDCFRYKLIRLNNEIRVMKIFNKASNAGGVMHPHYSKGDPVGAAHFMHSGLGVISVSSMNSEKPMENVDLKFNYSWDSDEAACQYTIDGKLFQLWEISKRGLEPLFF